MDISIIDSYDNEAYAYDAGIVTSTRRETPPRGAYNRFHLNPQRQSTRRLPVMRHFGRTEAIPARSYTLFDIEEHMSDQLTTQKSSPLLSRLHIEPEERLGIRETFGRNGGVSRTLTRSWKSPSPKLYPLDEDRES